MLIPAAVRRVKASRRSELRALGGLNLSGNFGFQGPESKKLGTT